MDHISARCGCRIWNGPKGRDGQTDVMDWPVAPRAWMLWTESTLCCSAGHAFLARQKKRIPLLPSSDLAFKSGELLSPSTLVHVLNGLTFSNFHLATTLSHLWLNIHSQGFVNSPWKLFLLGVDILLTWHWWFCSVQKMPVPNLFKLTHPHPVAHTLLSMESLWCKYVPKSDP